jgi:hypothetical protein
VRETCVYMLSSLAWARVSSAFLSEYRSVDANPKLDMMFCPARDNPRNLISRDTTNICFFPALLRDAIAVSIHPYHLSDIESNSSFSVSAERAIVSLSFPAALVKAAYSLFPALVMKKAANNKPLSGPAQGWHKRQVKRAHTKTKRRFEPLRETGTQCRSNQGRVQHGR